MQFIEAVKIIKVNCYRRQLETLITAVIYLTDYEIDFSIYP